MPSQPWRELQAKMKEAKDNNNNNNNNYEELNRHSSKDSKPFVLHLTVLDQLTRTFFF